jgi:hypothetical protein
MRRRRSTSNELDHRRKERYKEKKDIIHKKRKKEKLKQKRVK